MDTYGFRPDLETQKKGGRHSFVYGSVRNYGSYEKEPRVLAKVLHEQGIDRPVSAGYMGRKHFMEAYVKPLTEQLKVMDENFGEFIPPYYLEVSEEEKKDIFGDLDIPITLNSYLIEEPKEMTLEMESKFKEDMLTFLNKCTQFLKTQIQRIDSKEISNIMLPDIQINNFKFGSHMGDEKNRLYFIDQSPVFVSADRVINGLWLEQLERKYPFTKDAINEMTKVYENRFENT